MTLQYTGCIKIYNLLFDLCEGPNKTGEFQKCICLCVITLEMTAIDYLLTLPWWKSLCHSCSCDQQQPESFSRRIRVAQDREPGNKIAVGTSK